MFASRSILVVEDDNAERMIIERHFHELKGRVKFVGRVTDALELIATETFDFILSDLHLETESGVDLPDGLKVISFAKISQPSAVIVATSSDPRSDIWAEALKAGAQNFIRKPLAKSDELVIAFGLATERKILIGKKQRKVASSGQWTKYESQYPDEIVLDRILQKRIAGMARFPDKPCVIVGETGTGKEEIARLIHRYRCQGASEIPFIAVNCATIANGLTESILFGHRKGAFTGADSSTIGFIGEANRGILFLDEIHTLDIKTQQKLLRVLNDGTYTRLGETKTSHSEFQLVAASIKDLDQEVENGNFLLDLRTRMIGLDIHLKPLRDRKDDIPALTALFLAKRRLILNDIEFKDLVSHLQKFLWNGNIRQLFKTLDAWVLMCELDEVPLTVENFPSMKGMVHQDGKPIDQVSLSKSRDITEHPLDCVRKALNEDYSLEVVMESLEKSIIKAALLRHRYKIAAVANALQVPRSSLDAKRRKYDLNLN